METSIKKVLFLDSTHPHLVEALAHAGIICEADYTSSKEEILDKISHYDGIVIRSRFKLEKDFLDRAKNIKFIARVGAGLENIEVDYAESVGITCLHAPEGNRDAVGEHALGMILALFNNLCRANAEVRQGKWIREGNRGIELQGKTIGIIGYGNMGSAFAQRLAGFNVQVIAYDKYKSNFSDHYATESTLENLMEQSDIISLHVPLTQETNYMVNDLFINSFAKNIYIINTARGKVLNTADLVKNIENGKVLGACLDVLEFEKISFENLEMELLPPPFQYLINSDKVILSPHIAGWTNESNYKLADVLVNKILYLNK